MKKQLLFVHGGEAFSQYEDFLEYLHTQNIDPHKEKSKRWNNKDTLQSALGEEWEVFRPIMPNGQNARYEEWKIWFERHVDFLRDGTILVGHSQGAMFFARYIAENDLPIKISKLFLVAGAATGEGLEGEDGGDFYASVKDLKNITEKIPDTYIYHSKDDFVVPYKNAELFVEHMPDAKLVSFEDRGHFLQEEFPELIQNIKDV